ncbi:MAG: hypothetical protein DMG85_18580 [Acidobacteria bacterium]|nr:MAG: hypothetical protein DMG85_18580 [Acidobacteriota bacterium]
MAGKNIANPTAVIRSALLMLRHLGEYEAATKIRNALEKVYRTRDKLTRDVGGKAGTSEFADSIQKKAVREFHDVGLVDGVDPLALVLARILKGKARNAGGSFFGDDLQTLYNTGNDFVLDAGI